MSFATRTYVRSTQAWFLDWPEKKINFSSLEILQLVRNSSNFHLKNQFFTVPETLQNLNSVFSDRSFPLFSLYIVTSIVSTRWSCPFLERERKGSKIWLALKCHRYAFANFLVPLFFLSVFVWTICPFFWEGGAQSVHFLTFVREIKPVVCKRGRKKLCVSFCFKNY